MSYREYEHWIVQMSDPEGAYAEKTFAASARFLKTQLLLGSQVKQVNDAISDSYNGTKAAISRTYNQALDSAKERIWRASAAPELLVLYDEGYDIALCEKALLLNRRDVDAARKWILEHLRGDEDDLGSRVQLEPKAVLLREGFSARWVKQSQQRAIYEVSAMRDWLLEQEEGGLNVWLAGVSKKKKAAAREKRTKREEELGRKKGEETLDVKAMLKKSRRSKK